MAAERTKKKNTLWNFLDNLEGDKVVWMIVLLLMLISIVAIFSSTSQLALQKGTTRMSILKGQMMTIVGGLAVILVCYSIKSLRFFRFFSQFGYLVSILLLMALAVHKPIGFLHPVMLNSAWRVIEVFGFQIHVFEVVKVAMVMYLAWAVNAFQTDSFAIAGRLSKAYPVFGKAWMKKLLYIYIPIFSVCIGIMMGSLSSTLFIGGIMFVTILIGGMSIKDLLLPGAVGVALLLGCVGINAVAPEDHKPFPHLQSALNRLDSESDEKYMKDIANEPQNSKQFQKALDKMKQPVSAKIAIHEGGLFGKGPGRSTQRYVVPIMFEDYMFSFIVEEYGLMGGILVIILYISLLARGSIIVRNCDNHFAKTAIAGLVVLITGQAMMHIMINCDLGPLTGQTLPMVSLGKSSFLMFSLAFGIILSISRIAKRKIAREAESMGSIMGDGERSGARNEMESTLEDLDEMESSGFEGTGVPVHENDIPDYGIDDHNNE